MPSGRRGPTQIVNRMDNGFKCPEHGGKAPPGLRTNRRARQIFNVESFDYWFSGFVGRRAAADFEGDLEEERNHGGKKAKLFCRHEKGNPRDSES